MDVFKSLDSYNRQARIYPGLLALLPVLAVVLAWFPALLLKNLGGVLMTIIASCGVIYLIGDFARTAGKAIEPGLLKEWGGWPTTLWLRHSDPNLPGPTKGRYHAFLGKESLKRAAPTVEEERNDLAGADEQWASAVQWLKEKCRGTEYGLVHSENATYGFRRNLLGLKTFAICSSILASLTSLVGLAFCYYPWSGNLSLSSLAAMAHKIPAEQLGATIFALTAPIVWLWVVNRRWVRAAGDQYARALLSCCDTLSTSHLSA